ncbi:hypothetical protein HNP55_000806 [Paucibacter oligotrophus]|uniref:Colicin import membrane protein n=1 Tax=Roseateles oligotrophus TaxID=1769250 RepID=A0A840L3B6_9BURK|nr:hypothetical protein [Roseateles oligotrophus]MBB4842311.1 hypothetical protein [Roseateles oligotrophus]
MSKFLRTLAALAIAASPLMGAVAHAADSTDPVVQNRAKISKADKVKNAELSAARKTRNEARASAKKELAAAKAENAVKAKAAAAEGKDALVVKRELDAQSSAAYKDKLKAANEQYKSVEARVKAEAEAKKDKANTAIAKEIKKANEGQKN